MSVEGDLRFHAALASNRISLLAKNLEDGLSHLGADFLKILSFERGGSMGPTTSSPIWCGEVWATSPLLGVQPLAGSPAITPTPPGARGYWRYLSIIRRYLNDMLR